MKFLKTIFKHELISGASLIFVGAFFANILNFLFNLFMTRNLSAENYGILATLNSLMTLAVLPAGAIVPIVLQFGALYFAKNQLEMARGLYFKITKPFFLFGTLIFILFVIFRGALAQFFRIEDESLIMLAACTIYLGFIGVANPALLQAKLAFSFIAFTNLLSALLKLVIGVGMVLAGFSLGGVMWGLLISSSVPYILSFLPLKFLLDKGIAAPKISLNTLLSYGAPASLATFGLTSFVTTDIILVKHFFDPQAAGIYATLSLVGRVIFFFSAPIGMVMFPLVAQKYARQENFHNTFKLALFLVLLPSVPLTIFYFLFPEFTIQFFSKREEHLVGAPFLGIFGVFVTIYALLSIFTNFYLSIKKTKIFIPITLGALLQAIGIWFYHESFLEVILISLVSVSLLLIVLLLYYWKLYGSKTRSKA